MIGFEFTRIPKDYVKEAVERSVAVAVKQFQPTFSIPALKVTIPVAGANDTQEPTLRPLAYFIEYVIESPYPVSGSAK